LCNKGFGGRLGDLLAAFQLPLHVPASLDAGQILEAMKLDKKVVAGTARLVLVESAGRGLIDTGSEPRQIISAIEASRA
jgi:3-dehydroquinate synthase